MPGAKSCIVTICKSNSKKTGVRFFSFPKDPILRKTWVQKCNRKGKFAVDHARICSKHFKPEDFEDEMRARLTGIQPRKLKKSAIPSLFLRAECKSESSQRDLRAEVKKRKAIVKELLQTAEENCPGPSTQWEPSPQQEVKRE